MTSEPDLPGVVDVAKTVLKPLIDDGTIVKVEFIGAMSAADGVKPLLSIKFASDQPQPHAPEVSRLLDESGLDVEWQIAT